MEKYSEFFRSSFLKKSVAYNMVAKEFQRDLISSDVNLSLLRYFFWKEYSNQMIEQCKS